MALSVGARVGVYEVTAAIGAGGMGGVYRARDTRLARDVAIKILPALFLADPHRVARFEREARVLAALNHPNIAAIHGLEELTTAAGQPAQALVLEFVDGATLAELIARRRPEAERDRAPRALGIDDALAIARQIGAALEAAHAQGIIHRDLKPANVTVRPDGTVKVLDFGLAKSLTTDHGSELLLTASPTISSPAAMTAAGVLLGTAAYMSPEQARGKLVDKRADIWAFGCVLYEMLSGKRAFEAEDVSLTLAEVMKGDPDWRALPADLPSSIRTVLTRCLQKDPAQRLHDMGDVRLVLDGAFDATPIVTPERRDQTPVAPWRRATPWLAGAIVGTLIAGLAFWSTRPSLPPAPLTRFAINLPPDEVLLPQGVAVSPDGSTLLYVVRTAGGPARLVRRMRDQLEHSLAPGTEGNPLYPEFSPNGRSIAFGSTNTIRKMDVAGGPAITVHTAAGRGIGNVDWSDDNRLAFTYVGDGDGLLQIDASGGEARELTALDKAAGELDHRAPHWLPGSDVVLFTAWFGDVDRSQIAAQRLSTGERRMLVGGTHPLFASSGHLIFARSDGIWAVAFDPERLELRGEPKPVLQNVGSGANGIAQMALGGDGSLVYLEGAGTGGPTQRTLVWVDRRGREDPINVTPRAYTYARLSPDGSQVALDARDGDSDIWIWNFARETLQRLTFDPGLNRSPVWSPDGTRIAFSATRDGVEGIYWQAPDGSGEPQRINDGDVPASPVSFSPDGTKLVFTTPPAAAPFNLGLLTLGSPPRTEMLLNASYSEGNGIISPDGRWLAYESNESGRPQIYVRPFPDVQSGRQQVSAEGGTRPLWSRDGRAA